MAQKRREEILEQANKAEFRNGIGHGTIEFVNHKPDDFRYVEGLTFPKLYPEGKACYDYEYDR